MTWTLAFVTLHPQFSDGLCRSTKIPKKILFSRLMDVLDQQKFNQSCFTRLGNKRVAFLKYVLSMFQIGECKAAQQWPARWVCSWTARTSASSSPSYSPSAAQGTSTLTICMAMIRGSLLITTLLWWNSKRRWRGGWFAPNLLGLLVTNIPKWPPLSL